MQKLLLNLLSLTPYFIGAMLLVIITLVTRPSPTPVIAIVDEVKTEYPTGPGFVYCVNGETNLAYDHSIGTIHVLNGGYLLYETKEHIIRIDGSKCKIEWGK